MKSYTFSNVNISFSRLKLRFTRKTKKLKKVPNFRWFFEFEVQYFRNHLSEFGQFFGKSLEISFSFQIKNKSSKKISKFWKKVRNANSQPKNRQSGNTAKFWRDRKNGCRIWNQRPKINKVWLVSDKVYFCCWPL